MKIPSSLLAPAQLYLPVDPAPHAFTSPGSTWAIWELLNQP